MSRRVPDTAQPRATVLLVAPPPEERAALAAALSGQGLEVVQVATGEEGRERLSATRVDCVLAWAERTVHALGEHDVPVLLVGEFHDGADLPGVVDRVAPPLVPERLAARVRALAALHQRYTERLRRAREEARAEQAAPAAAPPEAGGRAAGELVQETREALLGRDVALALTHPGSLRQGLQRCAESLVRHLDAAFARIWTLEPREDVLVLQASAGLYTHLDGAHSRVPVGQYKIGLIAQERTPHLTNDVLSDPRVSDHAWARREGMVAFAGYPLLVGGKVVGVMALFSRQPLAPSTLDVLASVADRLALAIERKRVDDARQQLSSIIENSSDFIGIATLEGRAVFVNDAGRRMVGLEEEEVPRTALLEYFLPEDRAFVQGTILPTLQREGQWMGDFRFRHFRTGAAVPVHYTLFYTRDEAGRPSGISTISRDVAERQRTEQRMRFLAEVSDALAANLEEPEARLREAARLAVRAVATFCIIDVSGPEGRARRVVMAHRDPAREPLLHEGRRFPPVGGPLEQVARTGSPLLLERFDAEVRREVAVSPEHLALLDALDPRTVMVVPMRSRGQVLGVITLSSCPPDPAFTREDLRVAEELAHRVAAALDNARLYREAQRAVRLRDEFLSVASHELKTPLTPLSLKLQGLARAAAGRPGALTPERLAADVEVMRRQVRRLADLVSDLLDVSRIGAGRLTLEPERFDLAQLVREVAGRFEPEAERAGCTLVLHAAEPVVGTWDRLRLEQVVSNLVSNAIKYGSGRPVQVGVEGEGERVRVRVRDEGIGIAPEALTRIFEKFERAVSERNYGGLGLGLHITRTIVEAMGGTVHAESAPGRGATFVVELPREALSPAPGDERTSSEQAGSRPG